jgi:hypothetical protein
MLIAQGLAPVGWEGANDLLSGSRVEREGCPPQKLKDTYNPQGYLLLIGGAVDL